MFLHNDLLDLSLLSKVKLRSNTPWFAWTVGETMSAPLKRSR